MLRSRKHHAGVASSSDPNKGHREGRTSASSSNKHQALIPTPILIGVVVFFILLGIATEHYKRTRAMDPFSGRSIAKLHESRMDTEVTTFTGKSLLSPSEDESLETDENKNSYHVIFSTDCSPYQHWQRYVEHPETPSSRR
jgi:hypothetical protein